MATKVMMEALSPTMEEGRLVKWVKNVGDTVKTGDTIGEVETDKAIMELVARGDGVLRAQLITEGTTATIGAVIGVIAALDEDIAALTGSGSAPAAAAAPAPAAAPAAAPSAAAPVAAAAAGSSSTGSSSTTGSGSPSSSSPPSSPPSASGSSGSSLSSSLSLVPTPACTRLSAHGRRLIKPCPTCLAIALNCFAILTFQDAKTFGGISLPQVLRCFSSTRFIKSSTNPLLNVSGFQRL